jgi:glucose-1-phosphatase
MIRTIFFDFGNVLGFFDHLRAMRPLAMHSPRDPVTLEKIIYGGPEEDAYERGKLTTAAFTDFAMRAGQFTTTREAFLFHFADIFTPNPDVCELIPALTKRYRLVLASNTNEAHYAKYSVMFEAELSHFAARGPSHLVGYRKPQPDYFRVLQAMADAAPGECLFVDDLPVNIAAAEATVGWQGLLYRPGDRLRDRLRDFGIEIESSIA